MTILRLVGAASASVVALAAGGCGARRLEPAVVAPASAQSATAHSTAAQPASRRAPGARQSTAPAPLAASLSTPGVHHYEYVFPDQAIDVYDIDHGLSLVQHVALPGTRVIRGAAVSPRTHMLYVSHGNDGGPGDHGSLLAYDLSRNTRVWDRTYARGIDSMAISADGSRIYMPDGELSSDGVWTVIDARSGGVTGQINGGLAPHNTVVGASGRRVYLGGRDSPYLSVADTRTDRVIRRIGPLKSGVRPFTVNGRETLAYTTATGFLGAQVSSIATGHTLYTLTFGPGYPYDRAQFAPSAPSHGISLSPDERQLWVIDGPNSYVHVFDVSGLPKRAPRRIADIRLAHRLVGNEAGCIADCARDGWLQHSRSGCLVFVGDSGDVLSAATYRPVAFLPALRESRKHLEVDWRGGQPIATTSRTGLGYVTGGSPARPRCP